MTDRVPGAPGQFQAQITAEEQQKLLAAEPFAITLTRDDHPVVQGTPYSKAAVLPDEVAQMICPYVDDPTPADALRALAERMQESQEYPGCYYRKVGSETEWFNPPMVLGKSYRTTERYKGKPVYIKTMDLGALPAGTSTQAGYKWTTTGVQANQVLWWDTTFRKKITDAETGVTNVGILHSTPVVDVSSGKVTANLYFNLESAVLISNNDSSNIVETNLVFKYTKEVVK